MTTVAVPPTCRTGSHPDVARLLAERVPGRPLAGELYTSQEVFDLDVAAVFARSWLLVATEPEIAEPGDYLTVDVGPYSVILVRDDDEQLRALHNVCRHRGARVLTEPSGSVGNLVCGYHRWTYGLDGALRHAGVQAPGFDACSLGLRPVHVRSVAGLVFLSLAAEPPTDFDSVAERVTRYLEPHQLARTRVAAQVDLVEEGNWKLVMENNRECYHCDGHPELLATFFPTYGCTTETVPPRLRAVHQRALDATADLQHACEVHGLAHELVEELDDRVSGFRVAREPLDGAGESFSPDGAAVVRPLLGELTEPRLGRLSMHFQPNAWAHALSDHVVTFVVLPLSPDRTLVRTTWLVHPDAVEGRDYDLAALTDVWRATNAQDGELVARAQRGVADPAYLPGPYAPSEYQVDAFTTWYTRRLAEHLGTDAVAGPR